MSSCAAAISTPGKGGLLSSLSRCFMHLLSASWSRVCLLPLREMVCSACRRCEGIARTAGCERVLCRTQLNTYQLQALLTPFCTSTEQVGKTIICFCCHSCQCCCCCR
jgi:hypothetical protein